MVIKVCRAWKPRALPIRASGRLGTIALSHSIVMICMYPASVDHPYQAEQWYAIDSHRGCSC
ncbi:hypothetical protein BDV93DRAFT_527784 [Ceratobasidium sp. AG-I]|nr:hypothetical protein BDV93DRAFT_527784 [Ceratobasidium sp. AG-I]